MTGWPPRRTPLTYRSMKKERLTFIWDQQPRNRGIALSVSQIALVFLFVAILVVPILGWARHFECSRVPRS